MESVDSAIGDRSDTVDLLFQNGFKDSEVQ